MQLSDYYDAVIVTPNLAADILTASRCSDYFVQQMQSWNQAACNNWFAVLESGKQRPEALIKLTQLAQISRIVDDKEFKYALRQWRHACQMALICANANAYFKLDTLLQLTSLMADEAIKVVHQRAHHQVSQLHGHAYRDGGKQEQLLSVLAMGKLGADELNLSSDIDLIFVYHFSGQTQALKDQLAISNHEFFLKVARKIIDYLDQKTAQGFVYRVDMRLRPWGDSGQLVVNYNSFCKYYQNNARYWERFAMIKMRPVCGHRGLNQLINKFILHFVYRRYVDFQAKTSLRQLKQSIEKEQSRNSTQIDVKLSKGGIREIEFIVQALQLIHGGKQPLLQFRNIFTNLEHLEQLKLLCTDDVQRLTKEYIFLRNVEHAIQSVNDQQTQILPIDSSSLQKITCILKFEDSNILLSELTASMQWVAAKFESLMQKKKQALVIAPKFSEVLEIVQKKCYKGALLSPAFSDMLQQLFASKVVQALSFEVTQRLQYCVLLMISQAQDWVTCDDKLLAARVLAIIEAILRRSSYLLMLSEHPQSFSTLLSLCQRSAFLANMLAEKPFLIQQLLDVNQLYRLQDQAALTHQLRQQLLRVDVNDLELQMQVLRQFKHSHIFCAAACEIQSSLAITQVSDYLSDLAEVILHTTSAIARQHIEHKHGQPDQGAEDFSIIGYGKLAGKELNYHSDLDVVFIYAGAKGQTNGIKPIETSMFYSRIVQRILHILTANTHYGYVYEIDMRLRPSGNSGALVSSFQAFVNYQFKSAWLWEHQALIRSRFICGGLEMDFNDIRIKVLQQSRQDKQIIEQVRAMREKMRQHLSKDSADCFDIKQGNGGLVDIEFMVQALVLLLFNSNSQPNLVTDNLQLLQLLQKHQLLTAQQSEYLQQTYLELRQILHFLALQLQPAMVFADSKLPTNLSWQQILRIRENIEEIWQQIMLSSCQ